MAKFKIDEDLPEDVALLVQAAGHEAMTVVQQEMRGWTDDRLWPALVTEGRSLLTADVGFGDARRLVGTSGVGIVLLRLWPESRRGYLELVRDFIASYPLDRVAGCIITVTPDSIRIHKPAIT